MSPLAEQGQQDFGAGSQLEVAPHLISPTGFNLCENGLLYDDGSVYKRGGSVEFGAAAFGAAGKFIWEGQMTPGRRTVVANGEDFGVTAGDSPGTAIVNLGGVGFTTVPKAAVYFQHMLFIGGGLVYGGSRKAADYSTGTVTVAASKTVTGAGTSWTANVDAGMLFRISASERAYTVAAVLSDTSIELTEAYEGTVGATKSYALTRLIEANGPYKAAPYYVVAGERLICLSNERMDFSEPNKPHLFNATIFPQETVVENFHNLPEGNKTLGAATIGIDKVLWFHTGGITTVSNMAKSIVDGLGNSQHRLDVYSRDVVLWGNVGIAPSKSTFIVPAIDNVYLVDGQSAPQPLADAVIPRYRERILEGATPGGAWVAREHYFLPILNSGGEPVDLLACRLDKPYSYRNKELYPWTYLTGAGAEIAYATVRHPATVGETPRALAMAGDGSLVDVLPWFFPSEANAYDHDGSVPEWSLLTRDYGIGNEAITRWRRVQLFYELWPLAETVAPGIAAEIGTGVREAGEALWDHVDWDEFNWVADDEGEFRQLEGQAPPNGGSAGQFVQNEKVWMDNTRARYVRYRLWSADPVAKLVLRGLLLFPAEQGGVRHSRVN